MSIDSVGNLKVFATVDVDEQALRARMRRYSNESDGRVLRADGQPRVVIVVRGDYSFSTLLNWLRAFRDSATEDEGIVALDADEATNRLRVSVKSPVYVEKVQQLGGRMGIPAAALRVDVMSGEFSLATSLQDKIRTALGGGIQTVNRNAGFYCTMGPHVQDSTFTTDYFLTASHCTGHFGGASNTGNLTIATWYGSGPRSDAFSGDTVFKTGRTSGTTKGPVTATCVDVGPFSPDMTEVTCATEVAARVEGGDSGAPVYHWRPPLTLSTRQNDGVVFGSYFDGSVYKYYYTGSSTIDTALGRRWF